MVEFRKMQIEGFSATSKKIILFFVISYILGVINISKYFLAGKLPSNHTFGTVLIRPFFSLAFFILFLAISMTISHKINSKVFSQDFEQNLLSSSKFFAFIQFLGLVLYLLSLLV